MVYALVALAFVLVYKASRIVNFALGEWLTMASRLVSCALNALGLGLLGATIAGSCGRRDCSASG